MEKTFLIILLPTEKNPCFILMSSKIYNLQSGKTEKNSLNSFSEDSNEEKSLN